MPLRAKLLTELVGSFVFMSVIALSASAGSLAPVAIGLALAAMVYMGGPISGGQYNPAVSLALFLRRAIDWRAMLAFWVAQLMGGVLAFAVANLLSGHSPGIHPGAGISVWAALSAEIMFTAALAIVVLNVAATRETAGLAVGFTVAAGAFAVGPISGAAFNPAVGFGATAVAAVAGHGSWAYLWLYVIGPFAGAAVGVGIHSLQAIRKS
jgi:aquaporin Z